MPGRATQRSKVRLARSDDAGAVAGLLGRALAGLKDAEVVRAKLEALWAKKAAGEAPWTAWAGAGRRLVDQLLGDEAGRKRHLGLVAWACRGAGCTRTAWRDEIGVNIPYKVWRRVPGSGASRCASGAAAVLRATLVGERPRPRRERWPDSEDGVKGCSGCAGGV